MNRIYMISIAFIANITMSYTCFAFQSLNALAHYNATETLNPKVLTLAKKAIYCAKQLGDIEKDQQIVTIVDFTLPSYDKRLWVYDLSTNSVLYNTQVTHGLKSGDINPTYFSNVNNSNKSSIGLFLGGSEYYGRDGHSLHLHGLEENYNSNAYKRSIVVHSADYVSAEFVVNTGRIGRSNGCFAVNKDDRENLFKYLDNRGPLFAYYNDKQWLQSSKYLNCKSTYSF